MNATPTLLRDTAAPPRGFRTNAWGVCPTCRMQNGYLSVDRKHYWMVCDVHEVMWSIRKPWNCCDPTPEERHTAADKLAAYEEVMPFSISAHGTDEERAAYFEMYKIAGRLGLNLDVSVKYITDPDDPLAWPF